ncbi:MAG TPA: bifunctional DNA primase/polymerase [Candidatus Paceibacterota bacterium]|nr:bifunctional DNA primase/polymerase [Candidatus Paceibacterota bacterium]
MNNDNQTLQRMIEYRELGFSVFPITPGAKNPPLVKWKEYQNRHATPEQIQTWCTNHPNANIGIVTGAISGIVVLDFDKKHKRSSKEFAEKGLHIPPTTYARTAHGGEHFFFKHPGVKIDNHGEGHLFGVGVDVRGDGGYVVASPSFVNDEQGPGSYEWIVPPENGFADMPDWLINRIKEYADGGKKPETNTKEEKQTTWREIFSADVPEGTRNSTAARVAGGLISHLGLKKSELAWEELQEWNQKRCKPPLEESELRSVFDSIKTSEEAKPKSPLDPNKAQTLILVELVTKNPDTELFRDQYDVAYVRVNINGRKETLPCKSRRFTLWLSQNFYETLGTIPQPSVIKAAVETIEGHAIFKGGEYELRNRVARINDTVWYDLADKQNRAVLITQDGWRIVSDPPTLFSRHKHQLDQAEQETGGAVSDLLRFVNVTEESQQILLMVYLVSCFIADFPHPILYVYGQQGSAKSTLSKLLRKLVDPSRIEVLSMPDDINELTLQLSRHHMVFYENVSRISNRVSDALCIAVTGGGISKRTLYTDADDFIYTIRTNVGINGINITAIQPDLLERCILLELKRVEESQRLTEQELYAEFELVRPKILGAIFDAVAKALQIVPHVRLTEKSRMADFLVWGCAIAEALGYTRAQFLDAYGQKVREQSEEALAAAVEAQMLITLMNDRTEWEGTPQALLSAIETQAIAEGDFMGRSMPRQPNQLMRRINTLKPNFLKIGLRITDRKSGGIRLVNIQKISQNTAQSATNVPTDQRDAGVDIENGAGTISNPTDPPRDDGDDKGDVF